MSRNMLVFPLIILPVTVFPWIFHDSQFERLALPTTDNTNQSLKCPSSSLNLSRSEDLETSTNLHKAEKAKQRKGKPKSKKVHIYLNRKKSNRQAKTTGGNKKRGGNPDAVLEELWKYHYRSDGSFQLHFKDSYLERISKIPYLREGPQPAALSYQKERSWLKSIWLDGCVRRKPNTSFGYFFPWCSSSFGPRCS